MPVNDDARSHHSKIPVNDDAQLPVFDNAQSPIIDNDQSPVIDDAQSPVIDDARSPVTDDDDCSHSRTPVIINNNDNTHHPAITPVIIDDDDNPPNDNSRRSHENLLIKQGRQIRALYELQKLTFEKVTWVQTQIKKQNNNNKTDLNQKVFNVS